MNDGHTKDHQKVSYKLVIAAIIVVVVVIAGFTTMQKPEIEYTISVKEIHREILNKNNTLTPEDAGKILFNEKGNYRFVDLRNPQLYLQGHIKNSLNVPSSHLFEKEYLALFEDTNTINIIYAENHSQACGPWMILKQLGYNNNFILLGGFDYFKKNILDDFKPKRKDYYDEKAKYDFAKIVEETAGSNFKISTTKIKTLPKRKKKKVGAQGSC